MSTAHLFTDCPLWPIERQTLFETIDTTLLDDEDVQALLAAHNFKAKRAWLTAEAIKEFITNTVGDV